jgi:hypothetical protein
MSVHRGTDELIEGAVAVVFLIGGTVFGWLSGRERLQESHTKVLTDNADAHRRQLAAKDAQHRQDEEVAMDEAYQAGKADERAALLEAIRRKHQQEQEANRITTIRVLKAD